MTKQDKAKSINQRLSNIAKARKVQFPFVVTEFLIERLLARLVADSALSTKLIFKGGFVALKIFESPRYTVDLDTLAQRIDQNKLESSITNAIQVNLEDGAWFHFDEKVDLETQGEYGGIRFVFRAGVGEPLNDIHRAQIINLDIGTGDPVTPGPLKVDLKPILDSETISWQVYPVETMIAEKLHALVIRLDFNSRSKDILDLCLLLPKADTKTLNSAIENTFKFRSTKVPEDILRVLRSIDLRILEKGWLKATTSVAEAPTFQEAFDKMLSLLEQKL